MEKRFLFLIVIVLLIFIQCDRNQKDYEEIDISYTIKEIDFPSYMAPSNGGVNANKNFFSNDDTMLLYYYSRQADSIYIFDVTDTPDLLSSHFFDVNKPNREQVLGITPISRDSLFLLSDSSAYIVDLKSNKSVFYKSIPPKYGLLCRFNTQIYSEKDHSIYTELIERNVPRRESGILDSRYIAKVNLGANDINCLMPKVPDDKNKILGKKYFTIFQDKMFYSYKNSKEINIIDLSTNKLTMQEFYTPVNLDNNIKSGKPNIADRLKENMLRNTYFGELFANDQYLYRVQYLPLPARNDTGLVPGIDQKEAILLEYNKNLDLNRVLKPDPGLFFFYNLSLHQDNVYALTHTSKSFTIYKFDI